MNLPIVPFPEKDKEEEEEDDDCIHCCGMISDSFFSKLPLFI